MTTDKRKKELIAGLVSIYDFIDEYIGHEDELLKDYGYYLKVLNEVITLIVKDYMTIRSKK